MMERQHDPKQGTLQSWTELFVLTEHWQSDMRFFHDELNFLNTLIDKYLIKLIEEDNVSRIAPLTLALTKLEARSRALDQKIVGHFAAYSGINPKSFFARLTRFKG